MYISTFTLLFVWPIGLLLVAGQPYKLDRTSSSFKIARLRQRQIGEVPSFPTTTNATGSVPSFPTTNTTDTSSSNITAPPILVNATVTGNNAVVSVNDTESGTGLGDTYTFYSGDGSVAAGWPSISSWISFDAMWTNNLAVLGKCVQANLTANSADETAQIRTAIEAVAAKSLLDHRVILAAIVQESNGCVRVGHTTAGDGTFNPGLMQSHNGTGTCNVNNVEQIPCSINSIFQMVEDGAMGTASGDGYVQSVNLAQGANSSIEPAQAVYQAARLYNSGFLSKDGDLGAPGATRCYSSDIANRLTGFVLASSACTLDNV